MRSTIASRWAVRLGYKNIHRMPVGYNGWFRVGGKTEAGTSEQRLLTKGDFFPECDLISVHGPSDRVYLNVEKKLIKFSLDNIPADHLFIEIFNELCTGCVAEINNYKHLYKDFNKPGFKGKIKIIGIGAGSDQKSINTFKKKYRIPFPLFADENWEIFECLGRPTLPTSYLVTRSTDNRHKIIMVQREHIENIERMIDRITRFVN